MSSLETDLSFRPNLATKGLEGLEVRSSTASRRLHSQAICWHVPGKPNCRYCCCLHARVGFDVQFAVAIDLWEKLSKTKIEIN